MDMKVHVISVNTSGKTKEEIEKEVASQIANELNIASGAGESKEKPKEEPSKVSLTIEAKENEVGYDVKIAMEGNQGELFNLIVAVAAQAFSQMQGVSTHLALDFGSAVAMESIRMIHEKEGE